MGKEVRWEGSEKIHFGWWIVVVCFMLMAFHYTPAINLTGLFVQPLAETFQVSRTGVGMMVTVSILCSVAGSLAAGLFLTRFRIRNVVAVLLGICAVCYFINAVTPFFWVIYLTAAVRGFCGAGVGVIPVSILINNWFDNSSRGKALGIAMVGSGVGAVVLNPVTGWLIANLGWRTAYVFFGALSLILIVPVLVVFVKHPVELGMKPAGTERKNVRRKNGEESTQKKTNQLEMSLPEDAVDNFDHTYGKRIGGLTAKEALVSSIFWILFTAIFVLAGISQSWNNNGASYLSDLGFQTVRTATLFSMVSLGLTAGKLTLGVISDRWGVRFAATAGAIALIAGYFIFIMAYGIPEIAWLGTIVIGFGLAVVNVTLPLIAAEFFGDRDYGIIVGYLQMGSALGSSLVPLFMSGVYEQTGDYARSWTLSIVLAGAAIGMIYRAYYQRYRERRSNSS